MDDALNVRVALGVLTGVVLLIALIAVWIDRRTESPIMRERVNVGSDEFLRERGSIWKEAVEDTRRFFQP
jgi:hypothetical protein